MRTEADDVARIEAMRRRAHRADILQRRSAARRRRALVAVVTFLALSLGAAGVAAAQRAPVVEALRDIAQAVIERIWRPARKPRHLLRVGPGSLRVVDHRAEPFDGIEAAGTVMAASPEAIYAVGTAADGQTAVVSLLCGSLSLPDGSAVSSATGLDEALLVAGSAVPFTMNQGFGDINATAEARAVDPGAVRALVDAVRRTRDAHDPTSCAPEVTP